ncbi:MAG: hypothetical protein AAFX76_00970 [Planctomycetota bacterium]
MLDTEVHQQIVELCREGDELLEGQALDMALDKYKQALALIPEPKYEYSAAMWIYTAIGDAYFYMTQYDEADEHFHKAVFSTEGLGNPYIHLRLGQCRYEMNDFDRAADELMRAYIGDAEEVFREQDPKYLAFLKTRADI